MISLLRPSLPENFHGSAINTGSPVARRDNPQIGSQAMMGLMSSMANPSRSMIDAASVSAKSAADTAYGSMLRNMSRMGINPQSPRFVGQMRKLAAGRSAMEAAARNEASRAADQMAYGRFQGLLGAMQGAESQEASRAADANRQAQAFNASMIARTDAKRERRNQEKAQLAEMRGFANALRGAGVNRMPAPAKPNPSLAEALASSRTPTDTPELPRFTGFTQSFNRR